MRITAKDPKDNSYWYVHAPMKVAKRYDNGCLFSIGWTVGKDLPRATFARLPKTAMTQEQWNHSGCQSYCILRGHSKCAW